MRHNDVKKITMGAMMLAILGITMLANTMTAGLVMATIPFFVPIPFILYTREYSFKAGFVLLASTFILGITLAPIEQVILVVLYGLIGVVYGEGVRRNFSDKVLLIVTFLLTIVIYFVTIVAFSALFGYDLNSMINETLKLAKQFLPSAGYSEASLFNMVVYISFLGIILQGVLEAFVIHMLTTILFLYLKKPAVRKVRLRDVEYPSSVGIISAGLFVLMLYSQQNQVFSEYQMIINFLGTLGFFILSYLGLLFFYKSKQFSKWKVYSIIIFIFTFSFYAPLHMGIGLFTSVSGFWRKSHE